jgi:hypothetical protein
MKQLTSSPTWMDDLPPSLRALLEINWPALVKTAESDRPSELVYGKYFSLIDRSDSRTLSNDNGFSRRCMLEWKQPCPSCYNWVFPSVPPVANGFSDIFANHIPKVKRQILVLNSVTALHSDTGEYYPSDVQLFVDTVDTVITQEEAEHFKHRFADESMHRNYKCLSLSEEERASCGANQQLWHLVRTTGTPKHPSVALSLNWIGALTVMKQALNDPREFSKHYGKVHRRSAPYKMVDSGRLPSTVDALVQKYSLRDCSLRVNRLGGPFGNANGMTMDDVRAEVVSPHVDNSLPRNNPNSTILVPTATKNGLYTGVTPYYVAAGSSKNRKVQVTQPRHTAIPRHSTVATGDRLMDTIARDSDKDQPVSAFMKLFTSAIYNGCYILKALAIYHPQMATSTRATDVTVANERRRHEVYATRQSRSVTRSVSARRQFVAGQAVFWKDPDGMEWAGTIVRHCRTAFSNVFEIKLHRDTVDGKEVKMRTVDSSEISPDLSADGLGDDDEYELLVPSSSYDRKFADGATNGEDYLSVQVRCGEYTVVHDASGGHRDHFTHCDGALLENKSSFVLGDPDKSVTISSKEGTVPPGALAYPRAKVYTVNYAMDDIELHQLHGEMHLCSRYRPAKNDCRRGVWTRRLRKGRKRKDRHGGTETYEAVYYPDGFAVLDWESRAQHS